MAREFRPSFPKNFRGKVNLIIFGEAPGEKEEIQGEPFVGRSGKLLIETLEKLGSSRDEVYISNIFWVRPPKNKIEYFFLTESEIKDVEYSKNIPKFKGMYLNKVWENEIIRARQEIRLLKPKVVLGLGAVPLWAILGEEKISLHRGKKIKLSNIKDCENVTFIPTYHPSFILRNRSNYTNFYNDIKLAIDLSKSGLDLFK